MPTYQVLALDSGSSRIGLAIASWPGGVATPYATLNNDQHFLEKLINIINQENIQYLVVGYPRGINGEGTNQSHSVTSFANWLSESIKIRLFFQDEDLTSIKAEAELRSRKVPYQKEDIDSLSATYILEDFINEHPKGVTSEE